MDAVDNRRILDALIGELRDRAIEFPLFGHMVKLASIDNLILMKRAAGRDKDLDHVRHLEALKKIIADE